MAALRVKLGCWLLLLQRLAAAPGTGAAGTTEGTELHVSVEGVN